MNRPPAPRRRWVIALFVLALAASVGVVPSAAQDAGSDEADSGTVLKARYDEVLGAEEALVVRIDASAKRRADLVAQVADLTRQIDLKSLELAGAEQRLSSATGQAVRARVALVAARQRLARATADMHAQAVASYIRGGEGDAVTTTVRAYENGDTAGRTRSYADAVLDHQRDVIAEFKAARAERDRLSTTAATARRNAASARNGIATARSDLAKAKWNTQVLSDEVAREVYFQQVTLNELQSKKVEIEARIVGLEKESDGIGLTLAAFQQTQPDYVAGSIVFANPIPGSKIGSPFGMRFHPILHYTRLHSGADVSAGSGTPIRAAADGVVVIAGNRGGYGNCTVIDHGSGLATVYAHQSTIRVQPGQQVKLGDVIGLVGSTGLSTGPHLHFEARLRGVPVDPTNFITF